MKNFVEELKWRALYAGKIKHQKAKDGTDGRTSEEVSKLYGGAASVGSSEEKTASKWKSWRDTISGKGLREWASKRSWWKSVMLSLLRMVLLRVS